MHGAEVWWLHGSHSCLVRWCAVRVIALASRQGGAGKTTLSAHLAVAAEASGYAPVALIDTDPQGGLAGWWNARQADTPFWVDPVDGLPAAVQAGGKRGLKLLVIDTPPSLDETIAGVMAVADLVVVPIKPKLDDTARKNGDQECGNIRRALAKPFARGGPGLRRDRAS